ncbi:hypothetical protein D1007_08638 [Hordeum vulgare]|nr:hypothetical protein D1007_08638 [Hordeum vulgare]
MWCPESPAIGAGIRLGSLSSHAQRRETNPTGWPQLSVSRPPSLLAHHARCVFYSRMHTGGSTLLPCESIPRLGNLERGKLPSRFLRHTTLLNSKGSAPPASTEYPTDGYFPSSEQQGKQPF